MRYIVNLQQNVGENALTKVMRQGEGSDVLELATEIRNQISNGNSMYVKYPDSNRRWLYLTNLF
ncbi:hypothetical protein SAMN06265219_10593 [Gracilimonas mengyeensis]|uniref:Uncharacterized protein n=1 Tax=Gracilimonas mengyeensis TaxID=1302730 RepID=A0A521CF49_9BACT|nr:hypothetical protein SAMN06265219_10593 [Gracilimonas mengyeensis]